MGGDHVLNYYAFGVLVWRRCLGLGGRRDGWVVYEVWVDRWVEGEGKGGGAGLALL